MYEEIRKADPWGWVVWTFLWFFFRRIPRVRFGEDFEDRAKIALEVLDAARTPFRMRMALQEIFRNDDLLEPKAALGPHGLALFGRLLDLKHEYPVAEILVKDQFGFQPITKLALAIFLQAKFDGAAVIQFKFREREFAALYPEVDPSKELMQIPMSLREPLLGFFVRMDKLGYDRIRPLLDRQAELPKSIQFTNLSEKEWIITLAD